MLGENWDTTDSPSQAEETCGVSKGKEICFEVQFGEIDQPLDCIEKHQRSITI